MEKISRQWTQGVPALAIVLAIAAFVVVVGLGYTYLASSGDSADVPAGDDMVMAVSSQGLPDYVLAADVDTQMAYRFAADRPDVMRWMVCYCGCGDHSGHKSALNCFIKDGGREFDSHGADCQMCVNIALDAKAMTAEGRSLKDIRAYIDGKYGAIGPGTDTPLPPA
ncbi:MAG: PCYCGC motif-containing (lipo)protein [Chloroflexota bacterium]